MLRRSLPAALAAALACIGPAAAQETALGVPLIGDGPPACGKTAAEVYAEVAPSVVQVLTFSINPYRVMDRVETKSGSGVVLGEDMVATNFHVVIDANRLAVGTGEALLEAEVIARDPALDIAVLRAPGLSAHAPPAVLAPQDALSIGQPAHVIGFPLGIGKSLSSGIISGLERKIPLNTQSWQSPFVQTDAAISAGASGGALVDDCGRLIGLVTLRSPSPEAENIGYAIPVGTLRDLLPELIRTGKVARPWHGLYGQMVTPVILRLLGAPPVVALFTHGFLVETVEPGSAADKAGIRGGTLPVMWGMQQMILGGDIITTVNGHAIDTLEDARQAVRALEIGQDVTVELIREGHVIEATAHIEERPTLDHDLDIYRRQ